MQFKTITFALQGTSHIDSNKPCQDKVLVKEENDVHFFGLADGASSAKKSALGAKEILKRISDFVVKCFDELYESSPREIIAEESTVIRKTLKSLSERNRRGQDDFGSTLLWIATKGDKLIISHLGDGSISLHTSKGWVIQSQPENGEFANETYLTTYSNLAPHIRVQKGTAKTLGEVDGILLASDGGTLGFAGNKLGDRNLSYTSAVIDKIYLMLQEQSEEVCSSEIEKYYKNYVMQRITKDDCSIVLSIVDKPRKPTRNETELICELIYGEINEENLYKSGKIKEAYELLGEVGEPTEVMCEISEALEQEPVCNESYDDDADDIQPILESSDDNADDIQSPQDTSDDNYYDEDPWNIPVLTQDERGSTSFLEEDDEEDLEIEVQFDETVDRDEVPEEVEDSKGEEEDSTSEEVEDLDDDDEDLDDEDLDDEELEELEDLDDEELKELEEIEEVEETETSEEKTSSESEETDNFDSDEDEETLNTENTEEDKTTESVEHDKKISSTPLESHKSEEKLDDFMQDEAEDDFVNKEEDDFVTTEAEDDFVNEDSKREEGFGERL